MNKLSKRIIVFILVTIITLGILPTVVFATPENASETEQSIADGEQSVAETPQEDDTSEDTTADEDEVEDTADIIINGEVQESFNQSAAEPETEPVYIDDPFGDMLDDVREDFFSTIADEAANPEIIDIDSSRIIHVPQQYIEPEPASLFAPFAAQPMSYPGPFNVGDTRDFSASTHVSGGYVQDSIVKGELRGQGEHVNIWVLDCTDYHAKTGIVHNANCNLNNIDSVTAQNIANDCDIIYKNMTEDFGTHANVQIRPGYSNMPVVGDMGNDGKVNFLLYDIYGDGGSGGGFVSGFFTNADFFTTTGYNALDMLHIDIGTNQGYNAFKPDATVEDKLNVYSTLAHELQHLLFYMYFGVYTTGGTYTWFNEALSELAGTYYVQQGSEIANFSRLSSAAVNSYSNGSNYGDLFNFNNSSKNYGMGKLFGMLFYKTYGSDFTQGIYGKIRDELPPAQNNSQLSNNQNKISSLGHNEIIGRLLFSATGIGDNSGNALPLAYYLFMESFASDGGMIFGADSVQSTKFYTSANPPDNLWAIRPVLGLSNGRVYFSPNVSSGPAYLVSSSASIPAYTSGSSITLSGYGTSGAKPASHEMLYKLNGGGSATPMLKITAPNDGNATTRYYALVPKDELRTVSNTVFSNGSSGADVYPLPKGVMETINTNGMPAYLFVVTLNQNVSSNVTYSWEAAPPDVLVATAAISNAFPRYGDTVTVSVTPAGSYTYTWTAGGETVGSDTNSYTTTVSDIGKVIRVTVTQSGKNGSSSAQTVAVAKLIAPVAPAAPVLTVMTQSSVTLQAIAGNEYSCGGVLWQDSPHFGNLLEDNEYKFYQRVKATATREASASSAALTVTVATPSLFTGNTEYVTTFTELSVAVAAYANVNKDVTIVVSDNIIFTSNITIPSNPGGYTLTITSDSTKRTLARGFSDPAENNGLIMTSSNTDIIFDNIIIDGNKSSYTTNPASLVRINSGGAVTLKNGAILQNNIAHRGGGVYITAGSRMIMTDGEITGNTAYEGGGVYIGGDVTDRDELFLGGTAVISGNTNNSSDNDNLYIYGERYIILGTGPSGNGVAVPESGMEVWVTTETAGGMIVAAGATSEHKAYFRADESGKAVLNSGEALFIRTPYTGVYGDVNDDGRVNGTDVQALILWINAGRPAGVINEQAARVSSAVGIPDSSDVLALILWINSGGRPLIGHTGPFE